MKNNNIRIKLLMTLMISALILILMSGIVSISFAQDGNTVEETNIANLTEENFSFTNDEISNGIYVLDYATKCYGKNTTLAWGNHKKINVIASDAIIKLIPDYLFKEVGITQHLGKQYGFYIETRKPIANNDTLISTVLLIKINVTKNMTSDDSRSHLKFRVEPIFQGDFAYVKRGDKKICSINEQENTFFNDQYLHDVEVLYPAEGDEFIIPLPTVVFNGGYSIHFRQHNKFYLTDVSNQTSLYNVNQPNVYDDDYIAQNDTGCFFSQSDFAYNGVFYQDGAISANDVGNVLFNAASTAFDSYDALIGFESVFKAMPYVGAIVSTIDLISQIKEMEDKLKDSKIRDSKRITYIPQFNNKDQQIANGGLRKDQIIAVVGQHDNLLFGINDFFEFDYQIHCQDINVDTRYATMLNIGVVSVVAESGRLTQFGKINQSTSVFSDDVKNHTNQNYKEIPKFGLDKFEKDIDFNVMPNNDAILEINPKYSGKYTLEASHNRYAKFSIYEALINEDGSIDYNNKSKLICNSQSIDGYAKSGEIMLDAEKRYMLVADLRNQYRQETTSGRYGKLIIKFNFMQDNVAIGNNNISLPFNDALLKFNTTNNINYRFSIDNAAAAKITLLGENMDILGESAGGQLLITLPADTLYYIKIDKSDNGLTNVNLSIKDEMTVNFYNIANIDESITTIMSVGSTESKALPVPKKKGYEFDGWRTSLEANGTLVNSVNIMEFACPELDLYAKWTPIKYTIYFEENGGDAIPDMKYIIEHSVVLNQAIVYDGHVFQGWYDNAELTGNAITVLDSGSIGDRTYYAKWIKDTFTVTLDVNVNLTDGIAANIDNNMRNINYGKAYSLPIPQHIGFTFDGWYKDGVRYTDADGASILNYSDEQDITLTAKWFRKNFYFKVGIDGGYKWLDSNLGEIKLSDYEGEGFEYNRDNCPNCYITQLKINGFTCQNNELLAGLYANGYKFTAFVDNVTDKNVFCWNSINAAQINGDVITVEVLREKEKGFNIIVVNEDGVNIEFINGEYGKELEYAKIPKIDGYSFDVFVVYNNSFNNRFDNTQFKIGNEFSYSNMPDLTQGYEQDGSVIFITPLYKPNIYTVNYVNTDNQLDPKTVVFDKVYNTSSNNAFPIGIRKGYDFCGWEYTEIRKDEYGNEYEIKYLVTDANGNTINEKGNFDVWNIPNDCTLKATWNPTVYYINYDLNGGTMPDTYPTSYTIETPYFKLPIPTKFGDNFLLWSTERGSIMGYVMQGSTTDYNLKAIWRAIVTDCTIVGNYSLSGIYNIVNLSDADMYANMTFNISNRAIEVTFIGNGAELYNKRIFAYTRSKDLHIRLKGINILAEAGKAVINAKYCNKLVLESVGVNYIGSYCRINNESDNGALLCKNLDIIGDELRIIGDYAPIMSSGGAITGNHGIYGANDAQYTMNVSIKKLYVTGGGGSAGYMGGIGTNITGYYGKAGTGQDGMEGLRGNDGGRGFDGGEGGAGISFTGTVNIASGSLLVTTGGSGGRGGVGGHGGRGGQGGEGADAIIFVYGKQGGNGGAGGNGGDGGKGGKAGKGIKADNIIGQYIGIDGEVGEGGNGGDGGIGGDGGLGGWNLKKTVRYPSGAQGAGGSVGSKGADGDRA